MRMKFTAAASALKIAKNQPESPSHKRIAMPTSGSCAIMPILFVDIHIIIIVFGSI